MSNFNLVGEILDTFFSLLGKGARWYNIRGKRICFIIWSICVVYWAIRDISLHLYSQALFCSVSLAFHLYGFLHWKKKKFGDEDKNSPDKK